LADKSIDLPAYRQLGASEPMASPGNIGVDSSANAPSLAGLSLLATISAPATPRLGYFIQAQCAAGVAVVLDDQGGSLAPTVVVLAGPATDGDQGGSLSMSGLPHTGRIRIYSSSPSCQMSARSW
jgi:ABC-type Fe3+-siderophore transport system permease subunit